MFPPFDAPLLSSPSGAPPASGTLLHTLIMASPLAIYTLDLGARVQLWNPAAERIFGWCAEEATGRLNPTVPAGEWPETRILLRAILRGDACTEREVQGIRKDGTRLTVGLSAARLCDAAGRPQGIMAIAADIADRRRLEAERLELLERERLARAEAEAAERRASLLAGASALLDASLDYPSTLGNLARFVVPALADYCLIDELEGEMLSRVALAHRDPEREAWLIRRQRHPLADDPERHPVVRALRGGETVLEEEVTDGVLDAIGHGPEHRRRLERLELRSYLIVPLTARGRTLGAMTLALAESGRRFGPADRQVAEELARRAALAIDTARLYRAARQAVRARERLLAVVSHDLRNSLATILLNASASLETEGVLPPDSPARQPLEWIARSAEQMNRLIHDLLDASSIEAGQLAIEAAPHDLTALVGTALEMCRPLATERKIALRSEIAAGLPPARVDGERMQQVLGNLLGNAMKFTPLEGRVLLRAERHGEREARISLADSGPGIPREHLLSIFDAFWQGTRGRVRGAGLGLAIAKGIVEAHGGRIWVESSSEAGSTFAFTVPLAD